MLRDVVMPELAESVVEGEVVKWLVMVGDMVGQDQPVVEVMTDKVTVELPAPFAGRVAELLASEGAVVPIHAVIARFEVAEAAAPAIIASPLPVTAVEERSIIETGAVVDTSSDEAGTLFAGFIRGGLVNQATASSNGPTLAVPAARALAREHGLDLATVVGSGARGRIRVSDVEQHLETQATAVAIPVPAPATTVPAPAKANPHPLGIAPVQYSTPNGYEQRETRQALRGMRRMIAQQMQASHLYTVRTLTVDEVDMTALVTLRQRNKAKLEQQGIKLSYLPFIFKAIASGLVAYPSLNTSLDEAKQEVVQRHYCNIGMAVSTDTGLVVPVIRDVGQKSILGLAQEIQDLANRARDNALKPADLSGSSFSITNIGSIGALFSFPIINVPDAAILGIHSIQKRAVVITDPETEEDQIMVRQMMYLSLSFDHRLVDGADAARFCKHIIELLQHPDQLLLRAV
jgi:2-oxoisovalerate dehydrogenase E2 component (dihydrolipoyl transacylase)